MTQAKFSKKGNTIGFDAAGRSITGWYGKDKAWHVAQTKEHMAEYLTNGTHKLFDSNAAATAYALTLVDAAKTAELAWWN